jgi:hypothetical protein
MSATEAEGRALGVQVNTWLVRNSSELDEFLSSVKMPHVGGLLVDLTLQEHSRQISGVSRSTVTK